MSTRGRGAGWSVFLALILATALAPPAVAQLRPLHSTFVEAWVEGEQVYLVDQDGRFYTVPLSTPGIGEWLERLGEARGFEPAPFSWEEILHLLQTGVSEETIRIYIETHGASYEPSARDLMALKEAGASEAFLQFLTRTSTGGDAKPRSRRFKAYTYIEGASAPREDAIEPSPHGIDRVPDGFPLSSTFFPLGIAFGPPFIHRPPSDCDPCPDKGSVTRASRFLAPESAARATDSSSSPRRFRPAPTPGVGRPSIAHRPGSRRATRTLNRISR